MQDMTRTLRYLLVLVLTSLWGQTHAQSVNGSISGTVIDNNNEPVIGAVVQAVEGGITKSGTVTDVDGAFLIKPLGPGRYDLKVSYAGYKESIVTGVIVSPDKETEVKVKLEPSSETILNEVVIIEYKVPLIDKFSGGNTVVKTAEEIEKMPTRNTSTVASTSPGVYSQKDGDNLNIAGARDNGTLYIIDGVQVYSNRGINLSQGAIDQVQVMTSGISAKYGDVLGGVVSVTTKGVSDKLRGGVLLEHSVEGFNHNLVNVNLSGPLFSKKIDSVRKKPVVGFLIGADLWYDKDRNPSYNGNYAVKDEVLDNIRQNPLFAVPNQSGAPVFRNAAEQVTGKDLYISKRRLNAETLEGRLNGKLDFQLADNLSLNVGGSFNYSKNNVYNRAWSLFSPDAIPVERNYTGRGYIRLTQRFNKARPAEGEEETKPIISNAYYSIQVDYQKDHRDRQHPDHGRDLFKYGYVGKFYTQTQELYLPGVDSVTGIVGTRLVLDRLPIATTFERSELNPLLANYTSQYYNYIGDALPQDVSFIRAQNGLINGQMPQSIYNFMYTTTGQGMTGYNYADVQQYAVSADASFDLQPGKTRHSIEFGLYYQQRIERGYATLGASTTGGLWQYMRQLTNTHIALDRSNPIFVVDGKQYSASEINGLGGVSFSPFDTIMYNRYVQGTQSVFDQNLRAKLGVGATDYINIDELSPETFSLDMFSADELLNSGQSFVSYYGYDYLGNHQKGQINFNDFFTKKDANGNYTRDIGAFRPNYMAGYILDKFKFKDILFNVGLRVERFDANTKVLKDPYSLYEVNTVSDARNITDEFGNRKVQNNYVEGGGDPSNIKDDYVVYVNNNESANPSVIGYRNGDNWYDPYGRQIEDPTSLKQYSGGRDPQPYLVDNNVRISDSNFNPNSSFTDYKPQINVLPRISFNFPISDEALFYAHYDVFVQRPRSNVNTLPSSYYFLTANPGQLINNPNLKPEKMFDYEVGFKQKISDKSAVTISAFYKERKDMIQVRPYLYAWPVTYFTYGNRDFSTTKGMTLRYDLRRTGNLRMDIAYTLQFADGTGSSTTSAVASTGNPNSPGLLNGFISAGLPNVRTTFPLDVDVRHQIVSTIDYRFAEKKGPIVADRHILQNAGVNFIVRTRSGEPYTKYTSPKNLANTVSGQVNGSRLPWHYMIDMKVDKDFKINFGKQKEGAKPRRDYYLNAYVLINNLLNRRDVLQVDGYTGRPDDDGYLNSPQGIQFTNNQLNPQSYMDLYTANLMNPGRYNLPRRINIGVGFNF